MKKTILIITAALLLFLTAAVPAAAQEEAPWREDYYRAVDATGDLSHAWQEELDEDCIAFMRQYHADIALLAVASEDHEGMTLSELARIQYEDCGFGYGPDRTGFQMVWDRETGEAVIETFGGAEELIPRDYLDFVIETMLPFEESYGSYGPMYATVKLLRDYLAPEEAEESPEETKGQTDADARVGEGGDMPAWYPVDPSGFQRYHDADAPRVVDDADIFTDAEESALASRLAAVRKELQKDIVIFTDVSTYGLERSVYAADFYDFNGYGVGDDYEGACLFICMQPGNRGWWTCCTGPETMDLYTEAVANEIDDLLYEYMSDGRYYEGVADWIENFRRTCLSGSPYTPDWLIDPESAGTEVVRVTDEIGLLTQNERTLLEMRAGEISQAYGTDVVIHTALAPGAMTPEEYAEAFYEYAGWRDNCVMLTVFKRPYYSTEVYVTGYGAVREKLTEVNTERLISRCSGAMEDSYDDAFLGWLDQTEHLLRTGRAPRSAVSWALSAALALACGLIVGGVSLGGAKAKMRKPQLQSRADAYLVPGSLRVRKVSDTLVNTSTSRRYDPVRTDNDSRGGGSSGRSSYSSSYSGSSGVSHSGSGRSF